MEKKDPILDYHEADRREPWITFDVAFFVFAMLGVIGLLAVLLVVALLSSVRVP